MTTYYGQDVDYGPGYEPTVDDAELAELLAEMEARRCECGGYFEYAGCWECDRCGKVASAIYDDTDTRRARDEAAYFAQFYATGEEG